VIPAAFEDRRPDGGNREAVVPPGVSGFTTVSRDITVSGFTT
jgi:hypothetical protein